MKKLCYNKIPKFKKGGDGMNFLIIDGNSIVNRAFYGIKQLNAKDGHFTNALYGFMNILLSLTETYKPEAVAVAFDVHQPTFRHKMYSEYKAGRKPMPAELFEQMEPLKVLLSAFGAHILECPGYEADDILGTLSHACPLPHHCYIATGDRDSLQLISENVSVLLTTTKMGRTQTVEYNEKTLMEEYHATPAEMIELKALQGDSSDNIPGVPGIGPKTASDLIAKYHSIDRLYEDLENADTTASVKAKLEKGKDSAFFSRTLGTIHLAAPINTDIRNYVLKPMDKTLLKNELVRHEMFKLIKRLDLDSLENLPMKGASAEVPRKRTISELTSDSLSDLIANRIPVSILADFDDNVLKAAAVITDDRVLFSDSLSIFDEQTFLSLLSDPDISKAVSDSKSIFSYCFSKGTDAHNIIFDSLLAAYLLDPNASDYSVETLCAAYSVAISSVSDLPLAEFSELNKSYIAKALAFPLLCDKLRANIIFNSQEELLIDIEIPLAKVLASMEKDGIRINKDDVLAYSEILGNKLDELEQKIYAAAGTQFNINSPKQLGVILFEQMGLPCKKKTKTGYSTSADVLEALADDYPFVADILQYRTYAKLRSTYCDGLINAVDPDGRIRCTFNQTETRTGRISSTEPNLQNIPVRTEIGREFRKFFTAEDGNLIVDADYSQIELRVLAALSDDKNMIEAFNSGVDIHAVTASKVFNVPLEEVTSELRSKAKAVNFGIVYGIGAFSLSKNIKSSRQEAENFIQSYLSLYSGVKKYMDNSVETAVQNGYAQTLFHRKRLLPELKSSNHMMKAFGERVAMNMPIQGTAADIIKIAMIKVYDRLEKEHPDCRLIMQVHDELMVECPAEKADEISVLLKNEMENAVSLSVKLNADAHYGFSWYEAKG